MGSNHKYCPNCESEEIFVRPYECKSCGHRWVTRYNCETDEDGYGVMVEFVDGEYVESKEHDVISTRLAEVESQRDNLQIETKKQKGIIFGERKFSEALCNDLRSRLTEVESQRDIAKDVLVRIVNADRYTWAKDGTDIFEAFREIAREALDKLEVNNGN